MTNAEKIDYYASITAAQQSQIMLLEKRLRLLEKRFCVLVQNVVNPQSKIRNQK